MVYGSIVSVFDRLSIKTVLTNHTGSLIGFLGTLAFIAVCLAILIPPVNQYFTGAYFQSQFKSDKEPRSQYIIGDDVILAMSFRNKLTGQYANHSDILQQLNSFGYYYGYDHTYKTDLNPCNQQLFKDSLNPFEVKDCIMIPPGLLFDSKPVQGYIPTLEFYLYMKCEDVFACNDNNPNKKAATAFISNLSKTFYFEFIFNSKVIDDKGRLRNQFHKVYSTQYESPDGFNSALGVQMGTKTYFVDDSILPWWNNRTIQTVAWPGLVQGMDLSQTYVSVIGIFADYYIFLANSYSFRYYKKLDFILGIIGGCVFLLFLIFWIPFSYINRTLQKMRNAEQLLLQKDEILTTEQNLHKINIPFYHIITRYLPGNTNNKIIQQAQNEIDIVRLIKKIKVTHRNLRTKGIDLSFKSKDIDFDAIEPQQFVPDRAGIQNLQITWDAYQAITKSTNTMSVYENNPVVLALLPNSNKKIDQVMQDQIYQKYRVHKQKYATIKERILSYIGEFIRFFDVFGAKPMLNAQPQTSSCWGFLLTLVIIILSILTFALTIKNMDSVKIITSHRYQKPQNHNYQITSGKNFRFAFCFDSTAANKHLTGSTKSVQLTFYKWSKKYGYQQIPYQRMIAGQFESYFQLSPEDPYVSIRSQNCFRPSNGYKVMMGGSYQTTNQAYFGARLDPYCSGTPAQCQIRRNQTISKFVSFVNYRTYGIFLSENKYSPTQGRIISGIAGNQVSQSDNILNASLLRTQTIFLSSIELLDDTSKAFARTSPKTLQRTIKFSQFGDRNQQKKGNPNADPGYILQFRSNGQVQSIILRTYKIDFLFGIIGGVFLFWYFFVHFFAKIYNSFKVRAKLAQILHQEDGYDESVIVQSLYLSKIPTSLFCCSQLRKDIQRIQAVDQKMQRDLDYLNLTKSVDTCFRLSGSLFSNIVQKDVSMIYFRQKIDEAELVKPKRIKQLQNDQFQDDQFLQFDDDQQLNQQVNASLNVTSNLLPQVSGALEDHEIQKIINMNRSVQTCPLYDPFVPNKKQKLWKKILKKIDIFKTPAQLTLDGQRDVKSIFGGLSFFVVLALIIIVVNHFLTIYTSGSDYTVSRRQIVDADLSNADSTGTLGDLNPGINVVSGKDFKFMVTFHKKDQYYPFNVSQYIGPIGIRFLQYTITRINGMIKQEYEQIQFQPCQQNYLNGFTSPYTDPDAYQNITLGYCLPNGRSLYLSGTPQDSIRKYFKLNIYNKLANSTGKAFLNSFFKIYIVQYHMSVPRMDIFSKNFNYEMTTFSFFTDPYSYPIQTNLTFSKVVFTDKYYSKSRETYNDKTRRTNQRLDVNYLSQQNARNVSFYYNGNLQHYVLDYPGGGELFGLVGGVIAMFVFIIYSFIASFNQYRMKYLIGQRLYTFDKKLSGLVKQKVSKDKNKKLNLKKLEEATKAVNNFNEVQILFAWLLNPIAFIRDNYNFNKTLRRITLLIERVQNDINLYNVYKSLFSFKDALDKKIKLHQVSQMQSPVNVTSIFIKHIHQKQSVKNHIPLISKQAKKHKFSSYQQFKINKAIQAKINPQTVFGDKFLNRAFGLDDGTSVLGSRMRMLQQRNNQSLIHASFINNNPITQRNDNRRNIDDRIPQSEEIFAQSEENGQTEQTGNKGNEQFKNINAFEIEDGSQNL